ncbi:MAG: 2-dehydropantoate 2-reductase [Desulfobacterales bacterium]|nr:2-dehydropantoate 2-reductase [Desulfobacterales bacterium]
MTAPIKKIAVIGAGAMGAAFASRFFNMAKDSVSLIAKGERYDRLKAAGLIVNGRRYDLALISPEERTPPADLLMVAVKNHHIPEAIRDIRNLVGDHTIILSVMNGIDSEEQIGAVYGMEKVLYAVVAGIDAVRDQNVVTFSKQGKLFFGEAKNRVLTERVSMLQSLFDRAGILYETPEDMIRTLWWKFMINVGMNQVSAVLRAPYRVFHQSQEARELMEAAMKETINIASARKVQLSEEDIDNFTPFLLAMSPDGKTSMVQDIEAGRKTEVEMLAGRINELGGKYGIPTPVNQMLFRLLRVMEQYP